MIRKGSSSNLSDEEFLEISKPFDEAVDQFMENIIYDYVAFYLAKGYEYSALWECPLRNQINSALAQFAESYMTKDFDIEKLNKLLNTKYNLKIVNTETSEIVEL